MERVVDENFGDINPDFANLVKSQNADGSWGDTNYIHCTSIAVITLFAHDKRVLEVQTGRQLKKGIQYLVQKSADVKKHERYFYCQAMSLAYNSTKVSLYQDKALEMQKLIFKDWIYAKDFAKNFLNFYLQIKALKTASAAGLEFNTKAVAAEVAKLTGPDVIIVACRNLWELKSESSAADVKRSLDLLGKSPAFVTDMILRDYLADDLDEAAKIVETKFSNKNFSYKINNKVYSKNEIEFLNYLYPLLIKGIYKNKRMP